MVPYDSHQIEGTCVEKGSYAISIDTLYNIRFSCEGFQPNMSIGRRVLINLFSTAIEVIRHYFSRYYDFLQCGGTIEAADSSIFSNNRTIDCF